MPALKPDPPPKRLDNSVPFRESQEAAVALDPVAKGGTDGCLDDGANSVLDDEENVEMVKRAEQNVLMALFLQFWHNAGDKEPMPHPDMASIPKLVAEGCLTEMLIFMGWLINARQFIAALPPDKCKAWQDQINEICLLVNAPHKMIDEKVGRLNHAACIIPLAGHFMNRLRRSECITNKHQ